MADRFPCEVEVGGNITISQLKEVIAAAIADGASLDWGLGEPTLEDALAQIEEEGTLHFMDDQASYGEMRCVTGALGKLKIPYIQKSDAAYEYDASVVLFDGETSREFNGTQNGELLCSMDDVKNAIEMLKNGESDKALEHLESVCPNCEIPPLKIIQEEANA